MTVDRLPMVGTKARSPAWRRQSRTAWMVLKNMHNEIRDGGLAGKIRNSARRREAAVLHRVHIP